MPVCVYTFCSTSDCTQKDWIAKTIHTDKFKRNTDGEKSSKRAELGHTLERECKYVYQLSLLQNQFCSLTLYLFIQEVRVQTEPTAETTQYNKSFNYRASECTRQMFNARRSFSFEVFPFSEFKAIFFVPALTTDMAPCWGYSLFETLREDL